MTVAVRRVSSENKMGFVSVTDLFSVTFFLLRTGLGVHAQCCPGALVGHHSSHRRSMGGGVSRVGIHTFLLVWGPFWL